MKTIIKILPILFLIKGAIAQELKQHKISCKDGYYIVAEVNSERDTLYLLKDSIEDGIWIVYYDELQKNKVYECTFKNGVRDGLASYYYKNGQKKYEETFNKGRRNLEYKEWYENGNKKISGTFENGFENGEFTDWHLNGTVKFKGSFLHGARNGEFKAWYPSGKIHYEEKFIGGDKDGVSTEWYESGLKKSESHFRMGELTDSLTTWYENGQIYSVVQHKNAVPVSEKRFYKNGQKMLEIDFIKNPYSAAGGDFWNENGEKIDHAKWLSWWKSNKN